MRLTDPVASFKNVQDQFSKIQQNFDNMKQGINISNSKATLQEWVTPLMNNSPVVPVPEAGSPVITSNTGDNEPTMVDKKDPILLALEKESQQFDPSIYMQKGDPLSTGEQSLWMSTQVHYQTRFEMIRGTLTFKLDHLVFQAMKQKTSTVQDGEVEQFNLMIDYLDIVSVSRLMIPNEEAADHPEKFVRTNYKFNYLIQIEVSAINGLSAIEKLYKLGEQVERRDSQDTERGATVEGDDHSIVDRSHMSLANIFFKVSLILRQFNISNGLLAVTRRYFSHASPPRQQRIGASS